MSRRPKLTLAAIAGALAVLVVSPAQGAKHKHKQNQKRPNVVVVMTDDQNDSPCCSIRLASSSETDF